MFAEDEAALLVAEASSEGQLEAMVRRRVEGIPLEHILGWAEFAGLRVGVDAAVFVPRRRTEFLAALAVRFAREARVDTPAVLDLCCGSGAIALVAQTGIPGARVFAADIDPAAVRTARRNLARPDRVFEGDLFEPLPADLAGTFDVIVANTPYVPTEALALMPPEARLYEARVALDGGDDGLDVQRRVAAGAPRWLAPDGRLLVEVNEAQAPAVIRIFTAAGLEAHAESSDEFEVTVVVGRLLNSILQHFS
ncbi:MAG: release factor glutamine methyltransferase [Subtercola sp.]|nr:release factor glutamine methyltransferase [Subtercola sp.]